MDSKRPIGGIFLSTLCAIFFFLWGGLLIVNPAVAGNKTVCPAGPPTCDYTSIWDAVLQANIEGGGNVTVGTPGRSNAETYSETIALLEGVNVVSEGDDTPVSYTGSGHTTTALKRATLTIIDGGGGIASVVRCPGGTPDASLDGFTIQNINGVDTFLITISDGSPTIKNNIIRNNHGSGHSGGIGLQGFGTGSPSPLIENNLIHNVHGPGVGNGPYSQATIKSNKIWDCNGDEGPGIGLLGKTSPTIEDNIIFENAQAGIGSCYHWDSCPIGIEAEGGTLTIPTIKGNTIRDNKGGIILVRSDSDTGGTINVTIGDDDSKNYIYDSFAAGIVLDGLTSATIHNNEIYRQNWAGIRLDNINDITISNNDICYSYYMAGIIFYSNVVNANVDNNLIHENGQAGIMNRGAATLTVQNNNEIYLNSKGGINIQYTGSNNTIQGNTIQDNLWGGIQVVRAALATVQNNNINGNGFGGIRNVGGNSLAVTGNQIHDNGFGGIEIKYGTGAISGNTIEANHYGGIGIKALCDFEISENQINDNHRGGIHTGEDLADGGGYIGAPGTALLTIKKNKVYRNGPSGLGGGIDVRHADGVIRNNLVYGNHRGGIRFGDFIYEIVNNTVVGNGESGSGAGIVYDDLAGAVDASPTGCAPDDIPIKNNISTDNERAGIFVKICPSSCPANRDYNLLCRNNGINTDTCSTPPFTCICMQLGGCRENSGEIFANPLFVDETIDDYHLQLGSPAIGTGEFGVDMGAYGGADPITP